MSLNKSKPCCIGSMTATLLLRNTPLSDTTLQYVMSSGSRGFSAVTVLCGMLGMGQTAVTFVPTLIVGGTGLVKNRSLAGRRKRGRKGGKERGMGPGKNVINAQNHFSPPPPHPTKHISLQSVFSLLKCLYCHLILTLT